MIQLRGSRVYRWRVLESRHKCNRLCQGLFPFWKIAGKKELRRSSHMDFYFTLLLLFLQYATFFTIAKKRLYFFARYFWRVVNLWVFRAYQEEKYLPCHILARRYDLVVHFLLLTVSKLLSIISVLLSCDAPRAFDRWLFFTVPVMFSRFHSPQFSSWPPVTFSRRDPGHQGKVAHKTNDLIG